MRWGSDADLAELFGAAADIKIQRRFCTFSYASPEHWVDFFRTHYGPTHKAFAALDEAKQRAFHDALTALAAKWNRSDRGTLVVPSEYLEVVITR
jgi:hypothetical protein